MADEIVYWRMVEVSSRCANACALILCCVRSSRRAAYRIVL